MGRLRRVIFFVHLWLGLLLGGWVVLMGLTGTMLAFMHELDGPTDPQLTRVARAGERVPLQGVLERVRAAYPGWTVSRLTFSEEPEGTYAFRLTRKGGEPMRRESLREVRVDPYSGRILGDRPTFGWWLNVVLYLHLSLLAGEPGRLINGYGTLLFGLLLLSGLYLWWPAAWRQLRPRLTIKRGRGSRRVIHDLHNVFGVYAFAILTVLVVSGVAMAFKEPVQGAVYALTRTPKDTPAPKLAAAVESPRPLDELLAAGRAALPEARVERIFLPASPTAPLRLTGELPGAGPAAGITQVFVHPGTGEVLRVDDPRLAPAGKRVMSWVGPLHFGTWGGLWGQALYALVGLTPLGLFVTGFLKWREKRRARARNRVRHSAVAGAGPPLLELELPELERI
ncbi:MAG: PepSY-associated TM helix domain-containing protein [Armatimonadota bacterium]